MFALKAIEKPRWAKKSSDDFYYRDRARVNCEGIENATKFENRSEAESVAGNTYEVVEL